MLEQTDINYRVALQDFQRARRQAGLQELLARLRGKSTALLSYEEVRHKLKAEGSASRGLQEIPLDAIVGSVGRYTDFTRGFLPRDAVDQTRWARVSAAAAGLAGLPPIEVYQIGQVYFVLDGNHRVSVAGQLGATHIQAYVTEVRTKVPLTPDTQPDELIIKARYADFLERTKLDELRPGADLSVTAPGQYRVLEEQIEAHRYFMNLAQGHEIPYAEAVANWYDELYLPVVQVIREQGLLHDFPGRTETDLYLWVSEYRAELEKELGWQIPPEVAAADLAAQFSTRPQKVVARMGEKLLDVLIPDELESGPPPGQWREQLAIRRNERLFADILVPVSGEPSSWQALEQAIVLVQREEGSLHGLHVVSTAVEKDSQMAQAIKAEFKQRCQAAGIQGELITETGEIARQICERARWADLVVVNLAHPPAPHPVARLNSGFRTLIRRCSRPVLAVPGDPAPLNRALIAYDGGLMGEEALFVAAYLAARWQVELTVITVTSDDGQPKMLARAQSYLVARGIQATFVVEQGPVAEAILKTAAEHQSDFILMGGYGSNPILEVMLGSAVDQVLREAQQPILICR